MTFGTSSFSRRSSDGPELWTIVHVESIGCRESPFRPKIMEESTGKEEELQKFLGKVDEIGKQIFFKWQPDFCFTVAGIVGAMITALCFKSSEAFLFVMFLCNQFASKLTKLNLSLS